jgi:AraC family transcriptional regulator
MSQHNPGSGGPIGPHEWRKLFTFEAGAASDRLGWVGLEAARYSAAPASELDRPPLTHHTLVLMNRPPVEMDLQWEGVRRHVPPPAGSILIVPAGSPARWRWIGHMETFHVYLEPGLIARVAAEAFDLDPARIIVPPFDRLELAPLRATMAVLDAELTGGAGGALAAESLANVMAVHLIRHLSAPRPPAPEQDSMLSPRRLRAVVEYVEEHLHARLTLGQIAAAAHLSPYHFARQFKAATGLPPHQYVIARRVERAQQFLRDDNDVTLAEVAAAAGFSDQSQFSHHFKRLIGVTPGQVRRSARIA